MMSPLRLETFEIHESRGPGTTLSAEQGAVEEARLASYEQGYAAGWEDAARAQSEDQARLRADISRNLQSLGFTFQEARVHVLRAVEPLLVEMVARLLPAAARAALGPVVAETLFPLAEGLADTPVTLVLNPASRDAVETFFGRTPGLPLAIVEERSLGEGQVFLRLGDAEARVDLDAAVGAIAEAISGFYTLIDEDRKHG
ncbi:MAG: flagellar biosynthesis protein [Pseudomonadota bacterium]